MNPPVNASDQDLDRLFRSYRQATEFGDASPNFMPVLWQRIEARRRNSQMMERFARLFAGAAVALVIVAGVFVSFDSQLPEQQSWVETLANHHLAQNDSYYEPVQLSSTADHDLTPPNFPSQK